MSRAPVTRAAETSHSTHEPGARPACSRCVRHRGPARAARPPRPHRCAPGRPRVVLRRVAGDLHTECGRPGPRRRPARRGFLGVPLPLAGPDRLPATGRAPGIHVLATMGAGGGTGRRGLHGRGCGRRRRLPGRPRRHRSTAAVASPGGVGRVGRARADPDDAALRRLRRRRPSETGPRLRGGPAAAALAGVGRHQPPGGAGVGLGRALPGERQHGRRGRRRPPGRGRAADRDRRGGVALPPLRHPGRAQPDSHLRRARRRRGRALRPAPARSRPTPRRQHRRWTRGRGHRRGRRASRLRVPAQEDRAVGLRIPVRSCGGSATAGRQRGVRRSPRCGRHDQCVGGRCAQESTTCGSKHPVRRRPRSRG